MLRITHEVRPPPFPCTHWLGEWLGPQSRSEIVAKRKKPSRCGNRMPVVQPIASHFTDEVSGAESLLKS